MSLKLAHIADVHFRALSRHDEYIEVFKHFVKSCKEQKVDHIIVCGDLFHTKTTGISPEYIEVFTWWIRELSSAAPLHITLGNHDGNLLNKSRQDAVSPIVNVLINDKTLTNPVFLYKKSGVYSLTDKHNLCVYSLFDEDGWNAVTPQDGKYNIAIYHGPVNCAVTEVGFELTSDVTLDFFKGYDLALLGDIHRRQFLGYRTQGDKEVPWIGYPGSTLQQNYAESLDHGYLLWTINDNNTHGVKFIELPNPKPFVTVDWNSAPSLSVPKFSRVRVKHNKPLSQSDLKTTVDYYRKNFSATEVIFNLDTKNVRSEVANHAVTIRENMHNPDTIISLLRKMDDTGSMTDPDWAEIKSIVEDLLKQQRTSEDSVLARNVNWSLKEFKFDNLFGFGEGNKIDFDSLSGIVGVFGPNRVGKSSIIGSLMYCMFNSSDRGSLKNIDMVNVRKDYAYARALMSVNDRKYVVERQTTKQYGKKEVTAPTAVNLFEVTGLDEVQDLNGEQRSDTDKNIKCLLGTADDFMLTSLSTQGDIDRFIKEGSSHRKNILTKFLDLDFFDKLQDLGKANLTSLKAETKLLAKKLDSDPTEIQKKLEGLQELQVSDQDEKNRVSKDLSKVSANLAACKQKKKEYDQLEKLRLDIKQLNEKLSTLRATKLRQENELSVLEEELEQLRGDRDQINLEGVQESLDQLAELRNQLQTQQHSLEKLQADRERVRESLKVLDEVPCDSKFPSCKFIKDSHAGKLRVPELDEAIKSMKGKIDAIELKMSGLNVASAQKLKAAASVLDKRIKSCESDIFSAKLKVNDTESTTRVTEVQLTSAEDKLAIAKDAAYDRDVHDALENKVDELESVISDLESRIFRRASEIGTMQAELRSLQDALDRQQEALKVLRRHEFVNYAFSKKGIPAKVLSEQLPVINREISGILAGVVDFTVELECDAGSSSLDVYINYGDSRRLIELCSGMEKMISSLAIRVAMTNVTTVPKSDVMIIDEGFGVLDDTSVEACKRLLTSMKRFYKTILIISHVPGIKDVADSIIEVQRVEKDSKVSV